MPITVRLDELLDDRGMTLTELSHRVGITIANLSILKTGKARAMRFSTLDAICSALACQPGELLSHHDDRPAEPEGRRTDERGAPAGHRPCPPPP